LLKALGAKMAKRNVSDEKTRELGKKYAQKSHESTLKNRGTRI
jgi:hypothetical protein